MCNKHVKDKPGSVEHVVTAITSEAVEKASAGDGLPLPKLSATTYQARAAEIFAKLEPNSVAIVVSNPEQTRSNDTTFPYRQSSDLLYVNGFPEPECAVAFLKLEGKANQIAMFVRPKDPSQETWTGVRFGVAGARKHFGANKAYTVDQFAGVLGKLLKKVDTVYYRFGVNADFDAKFNSVWQPVQKPLFNPEIILHEMRLFKSYDELPLLHRACDISVEAHIKAMQVCRPGMYEFQVQAEMEKIFTACGAAFPAYSSIDACGNNACTLHYVTNRSRLRDGELMLIDAAAEYEGYAADITRTFPVNGKFTKAQREIYELVLKAQEAGIRASKPGSSLAHVQSVSFSVLRKGLVELGILTPEQGTRQAERKYASAARSALRAIKAGKIPADDRATQPAVLQSFCPHGVSHWLGLDVHDVGTSGTRSDKGNKRTLEPGMCFTVEPGLYFNKNDKRVPAKYRGIGIRIEDDLLIIEGGNIILSAGVPKAAAEIEQLMAAARHSR